jgi:hypothetical protein
MKGNEEGGKEGGREGRMVIFFVKEEVDNEERVEEGGKEEEGKETERGETENGKKQGTRDCPDGRECAPPRAGREEMASPWGVPRRAGARKVPGGGGYIRVAFKEHVSGLSGGVWRLYHLLEQMLSLHLFFFSPLSLVVAKDGVQASS